MALMLELRILQGGDYAPVLSAQATALTSEVTALTPLRGQLLKQQILFDSFKAATRNELSEIYRSLGLKPSAANDRQP